jgi:hypothetical protein
MNFDLDRIRAELQGAVLLSPMSWPLAIAVLDDLLRDGAQPPLQEAGWAGLRTSWRPLIGEQVGMIAHLLQTSPHLRTASVASLLERGGDVAVAFAAFLDTIPGVTGEMIRKNRHRQEELLRRWAELCGGGVLGETRAQSEAAVTRLDYRRAQAELGKAEARRAAEQAERDRLLAAAEAARKEAEARGGYE